MDHVTVSRFCLARAVECQEICCTPPHLPSLAPLSQAQNIASPKMASHDPRAGSAKHVCCVASLHELLQLQIWTRCPLPASLFLHVDRAHIFSHNLLSICRVLSKIIFHLYASGTISRSFLGFTLASSPPQAARRRCNPFKVVLPSAVLSLPTCSDETRTCLSPITNLPMSGTLSITASSASNWPRKVPQRKTTPFLPRTISEESSYAGRSTISRWPTPHGQEC